MHTRGISVTFLSVSQSVCLSVNRMHPEKNEVIFCLHSYTVHLVLCRKEWLGGGRFLVPEILSNIEFHMTPKSHSIRDKIEVETRQRCLYCCFIMYFSL